MKQFTCVRCGSVFEAMASRKSLCSNCKSIIAKQGYYSKLNPVGFESVSKKFTEAKAYDQVQHG